MKVGITGSRTIVTDTPEGRYARSWIREKLVELNTEVTYTGMALGPDTAMAELSIELQIPFIAVVPWPGQAIRWKKDQIERYNDLLSKAKETIYIYKGSQFPGSKIYYERNKKLIELLKPGGVLLAVINKDWESRGSLGTVVQATVARINTHILTKKHGVWSTSERLW